MKGLLSISFRSG